VRVRPGKQEVEVVHGITSLSRERAGAASLLGLARGHWGIENKLHWVRDETPGEDRCRARKGAAAQALAAVRNVAVYLPGEVNPKNKAAATRRLAAHPAEAVALLNR
jgi:hypothetical protein